MLLISFITLLLFILTIKNEQLINQLGTIVWIFWLALFRHFIHFIMVLCFKLLENSLPAILANDVDEKLN